jgi:rhodanese-related sulfurtransferase
VQLSRRFLSPRFRCGKIVNIEEKVPDTNAMFICHCGPERFRDSALAVETLQKMDYKNVRSMCGGFKAWKAARLPVTK